MSDACAFQLADLTAVQLEALSKQLHAHTNLSKARSRLARFAKIRPHKMEIACALSGRTLVLALLAHDGADPQFILEKLLPLARNIEDEWFARDVQLRNLAMQRPASTHGAESSQKLAVPQDGPVTVESKNATSEHQATNASKVWGTSTQPESQPAGKVTVTYSSGGEPPRHPSLVLPPLSPRPAPRLTLGKPREVTCEISRRTATDRCVLKEFHATRLQEATFSTSGELPILINMLTGFPPVTLTVQDYETDQVDVAPPFGFHIIGLTGLTDEWDQTVCLVDHLRACVDKVDALLKKLTIEKAKTGAAKQCGKLGAT